MSGFDPAWLDLREGMDRRSRARSVQAAAIAPFLGSEEAHVADLAAGSGAMLRALAPRLPARQRWTLIDNDARLFAHARRRLESWADDAREQAGERLELRHGGKSIEVAFRLVDLAADPLPAEAAGADLVTASALFDLVGAEWLADFCRRLSAARKPLYASLIYDGQKAFAPHHDFDEDVVAAFNDHQRTDKGFGRALGPAAADLLRETLVGLGYACEDGDSLWWLGPKDADLAAALIEGIAAAVAETSDPPAGLDAWTAFRLAAARSGDRRAGVKVGHMDLLLSPPYADGALVIRASTASFSAKR